MSKHECVCDKRPACAPHGWIETGGGEPDACQPHAHHDSAGRMVGSGHSHDQHDCAFCVEKGALLEYARLLTITREELLPAYLEEHGYIDLGAMDMMFSTGNVAVVGERLALTLGRLHVKEGVAP